MLVRPSFLVVVAVLTALAVTVSFVVAPLPVWLEALAPLEFATARLRTTRYVDDSGRCGDAVSESWKLIAAQPDAAVRFKALAGDAVHVEGMLMAATGIRLSDSAAATATVLALRSRADSILVRVGDHSRWRQFDTVAASVTSGRFSRLYATKQHRVEC